jgi:hypothetical protein
MSGGGGDVSDVSLFVTTELVVPVFGGVFCLLSVDRSSEHSASGCEKSKLHRGFPRGCRSGESCTTNSRSVAKQSSATGQVAVTWGRSAATP